MRLAAQHIRGLISCGIITRPLGSIDPAAVQACSLDVHMSHEPPIFHAGEAEHWETFGITRHMPPIDPNARGGEILTMHTLPSGARGWELPPLTMCLVSTREVVRLPDDLMATVTGCSTLGRNGLGVHITAGHLDPGFRGTVTLELYNFRRCSILLIPGARIGQLLFERLSEPTDTPYRGRYQDQDGPTAPQTRRAEDEHL